MDDVLALRQILPQWLQIAVLGEPSHLTKKFTKNTKGSDDVKAKKTSPRQCIFVTFVAQTSFFLGCGYAALAPGANEFIVRWSKNSLFPLGPKSGDSVTAKTR